MITLYGIGNCDTIRKVKKQFDAGELEYTFYDYKRSGCPADLAREFLQHFDSQDLINTRGTTWRKLPQSTRDNLDRAQAITLMTEQPSIIKRPLLDVNGSWSIGYDQALIDELLGQ